MLKNCNHYHQTDAICLVPLEAFLRSGSRPQVNVGELYQVNTQLIMLFLESVGLAYTVDVDKVRERVTRLEDKFLEYKVIRTVGYERWLQKAEQAAVFKGDLSPSLSDRVHDKSNPNEPPSESIESFEDIDMPLENKVRVHPDPGEELAEVMIEQTGDVESINITSSMTPSP